MKKKITVIMRKQRARFPDVTSQVQEDGLTSQQAERELSME